MAADNFGIAFAGVALVTYMSSLTSLGYTATQYALLSSAYTYVGKFAKGFSGVIVEQLASGRTLLEGYGLFFIGAGLLGIPALVLCVFLARVTRHQTARPVSTIGSLRRLYEDLCPHSAERHDDDRGDELGTALIAARANRRMDTPEDAMGAS